MGFYGNIKNTSRTQFNFDKIYPNRTAMDEMANKDGIYAGRYVLVEYDSDISLDMFSIGYLKDKILYASLPSMADSSALQPYVLENSGDNGTVVKAGTIIHVPAENNFDKPEIEHSSLYVIKDIVSKATDVPVYDVQYNGFKPTLTPRIDAERNPVTVESLLYADFTPFAEDSTAHLGTDGTSSNAYNNYSFNFNVDKDNYSVARGYDSTVWQKTYTGAVAKYVMVAELNSVVPTFDLSSDAPSLIPNVPHFDVDSTNVYYNLHWQPQWGFRIKASSPKLAMPRLNTNGEVLGGYASASIDKKVYPSDTTTRWTNLVYDRNTGNSHESYFDFSAGVDSTQWKNNLTIDSQVDIPAAIYFNKKGFDPAKISYSEEIKCDGWENALVTDEITIQPSGVSGHSYNTHGKTDARDTYPDTQEISIMLPSIGDTMATIWDLIYGGRNVNEKASYRNLDTDWYNAKAVSAKTGLRMIKTIAPGQYTYNRKAAGTVAGVLNSAQDLLGMIITDELPADIDNANGDYIYYDIENSKYKFKHKTFTYTDYIPAENNTIPDNYKLVTEQSLLPWDKSYMYIDSATQAAKEFVLEDQFYPDKSYIQKVTIDSLMEPIRLSETYEPGQFFCKDVGKYPETSTSKSFAYNYFYPSYDEYSSEREYFSLQAVNVIGRNEEIYLPNTFYFIEYIPVELTNITYEPNTYYYIYQYFVSGGETFYKYKVADGETLEDNLEHMIAEKANEEPKFYKRTYILDTSLRKTEGRIYYKVSPNANQNSNAYYTELRTAEKKTITYDDYMPSFYYFIVDSKPEDANIHCVEINGVYYQRDDTVYADSIEFNHHLEELKNQTYYGIKIEYILNQGMNVIEITDDNAILVTEMKDLDEFKISYNNETHMGQSVFYVYQGDNEKDKRYIEVTYSNFTKSYNPIIKRYDLTVMQYSLIGTPYAANKYYYKVTDPTSSKVGSYLIDNSLSLTQDREYYTFNSKVPQMTNIDFGTYVSRQYYYKVDKEPSKAGIYFVKIQGNYYVRDDSTYNTKADFASAGHEYYTIANGDYSGKPLTQYYAKNYYYVEEPEGSGQFVISQDLKMDTAKKYYLLDKQLYVKDDVNGIYELGAEWPMAVKKIPEGVTLATREDAWELSELPGLGENLATLYGMILALYKNINENDDLTRDDTTVRGVVNKFNDLLHKFTTLIPGQFVITDDYGRVHSAELSTKQDLVYSTNTIDEQSADKPAAAKTRTAQGNDLITIDIDSDFKTPNIHIYHSDARVVDDVADTYDLNDDNNGDKLVLKQPMTDNAGHVVGHNIKTVTLPSGFKYITPGNSDSTTTQLTGNEIQIMADNTKDNFNIVSQNKWLITASEGNTFKIAHEIVAEDFDKKTSKNYYPQDLTPSSYLNTNTAGTTSPYFYIPTIEVDNAGHIRSFNNEKIKMPEWTFVPDTSDKNNDTVTGISYSYDADKDVGTLSEVRGHADKYIIQDYVEPTTYTGAEAASKLNKKMSIHGAFAKLQKQIDDMDYSDDSAEKEDRWTEYYVTAITEKDGIIAVQKSLLPFYTWDESKEKKTNDTDSFIYKVEQKNGQISVERKDFGITFNFSDASENEAQKLTISVAGHTKDATIATATTGVYGVTKLTSKFNATDKKLAMNGEAVDDALKTLDVDAVIFNQNQTIQSISETDGKISVTPQPILIANANIASNANIDQSKIDGLTTKLSNMDTATASVDARVTNLTGDDSSNKESYTVYGLRKKIDDVNNTLNSTINTTNADTISTIQGTESDSANSTSIIGAKKYADQLKGELLGNTATTTETITISQAISMIEALTSTVDDLKTRIAALEND